MKFEETCTKAIRIEMFLAFLSQTYDSDKWHLLFYTETICDRESLKRTSLMSYLSVLKSEFICKTDVLKNRIIFAYKKLSRCPVSLFQSTKDTGLFDDKNGVVTFKFPLQNTLQIFLEIWKGGESFVKMICSEVQFTQRIISETIHNVLNSSGDERNLQILCQSISKLNLFSNSLLSPVGLGKSVTSKGFPKEGNGKASTADSIHLMFVVLGWSGEKPAESIEVFDGNAQKWSFFQKEIPFTRAYHGISLLGNLLYVVGGFNGYTCVASTLCLDVRTREWTRKSSMSIPRCYLFTLVFRGEIYAIGGHNGERRLKTCEKYDPKRNKWIRLSDMMYRRSDASGAVLDGKILVAGGFDGFQFHNSVEIYDPTTDQWSLVGRLLNPRSGHCMVTFDGQVFALGGFNGQERLRQVEKFNEERNQWEDGVPMLDERSNFCCTVFQEDIYVIGGYDGRTTMSSVEKFDKSCMEWQRAPSLNIHRSAAGACVMANAGSVSACQLSELVPVVSQNAEESSP